MTITKGFAAKLVNKKAKNRKFAYFDKPARNGLKSILNKKNFWAPRPKLPSGTQSKNGG